MRQIKIEKNFEQVKLGKITLAIESEHSTVPMNKVPSAKFESQ